MRSRTALFGTTLLGTTLILAAPRLSLSPGPVTRGHRGIADQCLECHTPFGGLPVAKCTHCHPLDSIGIGGGTELRPTAADTAVAGMHQSVARADCLDCHSDHAGPDPANATRKFSHQALSSDSRQRCATCHDGNRPTDALHRQVDDECGACHTTTEWKPATFDHQKFGLHRSCTACHEPKRPTDELHRGLGEDCGACHTTSVWKPATFEHDRYFVLDRDHRPSCRTCHTNVRSYQSYTCYGCHEHSQSRMIAEHREEDITDLSDCVRCHRSAEEREGHRQGGREHREEDDD